MMKLGIDKLNHPIAQAAGIKLNMARADKVHHLASGNKIYKLKLNLQLAQDKGFKQILSFGGAFSNHIHALALLAKEQGFSSVGIIRGESDYAQNPTLKDCQSAGMKLEFVDRTTYKRRNEKDYLAQLQQAHPDAFIIPEGGSSQLAIQGCATLAKEINAVQQSDYLAVACGTGATVAGIACGLNEKQSAVAYAVLKDESLNERIQGFIDKENKNVLVNIEKADFGGYAKLDKNLLDFIIDWLDTTDILLDPIYTSKMCMRVMQQIEANEFKAGTSITLLHSGGLQGWRGMKKRVKYLSGEKSWVKVKSYLLSC